MRHAALLFLATLLGLLPHACIAAPQAISAAAYRARLQSAATQLERMEIHSPRRLAPVLKPLAVEYRVRRADGATQTASGIGFYDSSGDRPRLATRQTVQKARAAVLARLQALDAWERSTYLPADAQTIIGQLEGSGQIRTGPTWLEQAWADFYKTVTELFKRFVDWFGGLFPSGGPGNLPQVDPAWIRILFFATVVALLAAIAFLIWQAIGGRRKRKQQGAFAFSPEDAELLSLPPDELRARAARFAAEGNYREALRHLYIALLLNLDEKNVWRYDARRTNWEHIAALKKNPAWLQVIDPLSDITHRFDRVRYGNADCTQHDWNDFERDVQTVEATTSP